jgi:hypothetical protein
MKKLIEGPLSADSVAFLAHRLKPSIDSVVMHDGLKFYTYEQFAANIDTELVYKEGIQTKVIPGLKSFTAKRNANLLLQIEKALPVLQQPHRGVVGTGTMLRCNEAVRGGRLPVWYTVADPVGSVDLIIYSLQGRLLKWLPLEAKKPGMHSESLDISLLPGGSFILQMRSGNTSASQKFLRLNDN